MKYFTYLLILIAISPVLIGGTMITTMHSYMFRYDVEYNRAVEKSEDGRASLRIEPTETTESKIPFLYDIVTYASPYIVYLNVYSKSKNIKIEKAYILIDGKDRVELNRELNFKYQDEDMYRFETQKQSIDFDVKNIKYIEVIVESVIDGKNIQNKERYNLDYKKETGNRLWWAIMSV